MHFLPLLALVGASVLGASTVSATSVAPQGASSMVPFFLRHRMTSLYLYTVLEVEGSDFAVLQLRATVDPHLKNPQSMAFGAANATAIGDPAGSTGIYTIRGPKAGAAAQGTVQSLQWGCLSYSSEGTLYADVCLTQSGGGSVGSSFTLAWVSGQEGKSLTIQPMNSENCFGAKSTATSMTSGFTMIPCTDPQAVWNYMIPQ